MSNELYPIEDKIDDDVREVSCADTYVNFSFPLPDHSCVTPMAATCWMIKATADSSRSNQRRKNEKANRDTAASF